MADVDIGDGIAALIGLGLIALVGAGIYKALKSVAEYEEAQLLSKQQAAALAERIESIRSYVPPPNCEIHGADAELCYFCNKCLECEGQWMSVSNLCKNCDY
jgi:hypothetical protein